MVIETPGPAESIPPRYPGSGVLGSNRSTRDARGQSILVLDVALILLIAFLSEFTHFSAQQGRAVLSGDSVQYGLAAESLLNGTRSVDFSMRKPGYALFLWLIGWAFGTFSWPVVVVQHALMMTLPVLAYALGRLLSGRWGGWLAAVVTTARLLDVVWADRIMSDALFAWLTTLGLVLVVAACRSPRGRTWFLASGSALGAAWLTRGVALPICVGALGAMTILLRNQTRSLMAGAGLFLLPIVLFVLMECELNRLGSGSFVPSNGTAGAMLMVRAGSVMRRSVPPTEEGEWARSLLPERGPEDAYRCNELDVWVARHRAVHDSGFSDRQYDRRLGRLAWIMIQDQGPSYARSCLRMTGIHLLRLGSGLETGKGADPPDCGVICPSAVDEGDCTSRWYAYWALPELTTGESQRFVAGWERRAADKAPFGEERFWSILRYVRTLTPIRQIQVLLSTVGGLGPVPAILLGLWFRLRRDAWAVLASVLILEALFVGLLATTTDRFQFPWLVPDSALNAGLAMGLIRLAVAVSRFGWRFSAKCSNSNVHPRGLKPVARHACV